MNYSIVYDAGGLYAVLENRERIGPYTTAEELIRDMQALERHLAGCRGGAK